MTALHDTFLGQHILTIVILLPIVGAAILFAQPSQEPKSVRRWAFGFSLLTLLAAIFAAGLFVSEAWSAPGDYRLVEQLSWMGGTDGDGLHVQYHVGVDGISMPLLLLTSLLTPLAIWGSFSGIRSRAREYYALMLLLHAAMLGVFCARDLLVFYIFFEFTLVPLYFLIGIWGGPQREKAANMFFLYTLAGSMLTLAGIMYLGWRVSTCDAIGSGFTFDLDALYRLATLPVADGGLTALEQGWLFLAFFAGFAIKVPLFPFHTWLPLAHTEAPTAGSVILAGVLLKLGTYGFLRLSLPMLPDAAVHYAPLVGWLAVAGIIYGALAAWVQTDIKKLVAYSSVSHLGFCLLGMFSLTTAGLTGSLLYMINHGLSTGALFLVVGMIYERYHTREFDHLGGLARKMPVMAFFLVVFTLSSIGLPGLNGYISEYLVLLGTFTSSDHLGIWFAVPAATGVLLGAIYMLHMVRRVLFGPVKEPEHGFDGSSGLTQDLTRREIGILAPIAVACLLLGVYPKPVIQMMEPSLNTAVLAHVVGTPSERVVAREPHPDATVALAATAGFEAPAAGRSGPAIARPEDRKPTRPTDQNRTGRHWGPDRKREPRP